MSETLAIERYAQLPPGSVTDQDLQDVFTSAVRLYAARVGDSACTLPAVAKDTVTATEAVIAICALMNAADLNPFDVAMWYRRPLPDLPGGQ
ncbi:MAG: hypothetical protein EXR29_10830 [Betaproteobacteria bacterium]|nr:hypothetical protein [Betaproteobacteria bacterium]